MNATIVLLWLLCINAVAFIAFGLDKHSAKKSAPRIPEATLLLLALLGGSPAAWVAQRYFRHKTQKRRFRIRFWAVIALQVAVAVACVSGFGPRI